MTVGNDTVTIEYLLQAPVDRVWKAWTEPTHICEWFGSDPQGIVLYARLDVRVGGSFEITFRDSSGLEHTCFGDYTTVIPFKKLQFTWRWKSEPDVESKVCIELQEAGENTQVCFVHAGVGTASAHNYNEGWRSTFMKLERLLLKKSLN